MLVHLKALPLQIRAGTASPSARLDIEVAQAAELEPVTEKLAEHFTHSEASLRSQILESVSAAAGKRHVSRAAGVAAHLKLARPARRTGLKNVVEATVATPILGESGDGPILFPNLGIMVGTVTADGALALEAEPEVRAVTGAPMLNLIRPPVVRKAAAAEESGIEWGVRAIKAPQLWKKGHTG